MCVLYETSMPVFHVHKIKETLLIPKTEQSPIIEQTCFFCAYAGNIRE